MTGKDSWQLYKNSAFSVKRALRTFAKSWLYGMGVLSSIFLCLALTDLPYRAYQQLKSIEVGSSASQVRAIVVFSGVGMPSGEGLMQLRSVQQLHASMPSAQVWVFSPTRDSIATDQLKRYQEELSRLGVSDSLVTLISSGNNTRTQSQDLAAIIGEEGGSIALVTVPIQQYRARRACQRLGIKVVGFGYMEDQPLPNEVLTDSKGLVGRLSILLRYKWWSYLQLEIKVMREYTAIAYYWLRGWI